MAGANSPRSTSHPNQGKIRDDFSQAPKKQKKHHSKKQRENSKQNQSDQSSLQNADKSNSKTNSKVLDDSRLCETDFSKRVAEEKSSLVEKPESKAMENVNLVANISLEDRNSKSNEEWKVFVKKGRRRGRGTPKDAVTNSQERSRAPVGASEQPVGGHQKSAAKPGRHQEDAEKPQIIPKAAENQQFTLDNERDSLKNQKIVADAEIRVVHTTSKTEMSMKNQKTVPGEQIRLVHRTSETEMSIKNQNTVPGEQIRLVHRTSETELSMKNLETRKFKQTNETSKIVFGSSSASNKEDAQNQKDSTNACKTNEMSRVDSRQGGAIPKLSKQVPPVSGGLKRSSEVSETQTRRLQGQNRQSWQKNQSSKQTTGEWRKPTTGEWNQSSKRTTGEWNQPRKPTTGEWNQPRKPTTGEGNQRYHNFPPRMEVALRQADKLPSFIREVRADLFNCADDYSLAHCVSSDFRMGQGVAVEFKKRFKGVEELLAQSKGVGEVAFLKRKERYVYYLVTKKEFSHKPTMRTLRKSLFELRQYIDEHQVTNLAMPRIGSGLDRLDWNDVLDSIIEIFDGGNVNITVYVHNPKVNRH